MPPTAADPISVARHPHDANAYDQLILRVREAKDRHGQQRVSVALGLARATVVALSNGEPVLAITLRIAQQGLSRLDELDQIADAEAAADAERVASAQAKADALRDAAADAKENGNGMTRKRGAP